MASLDASETLDRLRQAFADASIMLDADLDFDDDLALDAIDGLDSVSRVRLTMAVEDAFTIEISPRENSKLKTIGDLANLIGIKRGGV
jgi:acyl carrier protein